MSYLVSVKKITELFYLLINFRSRQGHAGVTYERSVFQFKNKPLHAALLFTFCAVWFCLWACKVRFATF